MSEKVPGVYEVDEGGDQLVIWHDRFEDFQDHAVFGKNGGELTHEEFARAIDEGAAALGQAINAEEQQVVRGGGRGLVRAVAGEKILRAGAEKQFLAEDDTRVVENRLAGDKFFQRPSPSASGTAFGSAGRRKPQKKTRARA